jgi:hypothetical protein
LIKNSGVASSLEQSEINLIGRFCKEFRQLLGALRTWSRSAANGEN